MSAAEPVLRRSPIPVREPAAAVTVIPAAEHVAALGASAAITQGTLALALPWEAPSAIGFTGPEREPGALTARPSHDHTRPRRASRAPGRLTAERSLTAEFGRTALPEPREWAATFAQVAMEVSLGQRPYTQLIRWTSPGVQEVLARRSALVTRLVRRPGAPSISKPKLRVLKLCMPVARAYEVAAVMADSERVRAIAFRMEGFGNRWRVTAFEFG